MSDERMSTTDALARELMKARRLARYIKRTAASPKPKTRGSDIAPKRIGDGIKPNHRDRATKIADVFPAAPDNGRNTDG